jgi:MFS transporter, OFA family, oxalate/formate antiporter
MTTYAPASLAASRSMLSLAILSAIFFIATAGTFGSLGVVLPAMVADLGWSWTEAGLGFSILAVVCGLASYAPTLAIRTLGVRSCLLIGGAMLAGGFACFALADDQGIYYLGAGLLGLGFALSALIPGAYVLSRLYPRVSTVLGFYFTAGGAGGVAGPWMFMLAHTAGPGGWRGYWLGLSACALVFGVFAALIVRDAADEAAQPAVVETADVSRAPVFRSNRDWTAWAALRSPPFWVITAAYTANLLCEVTVNSVSVAHLGARGVAATAAAGALSLQAAVGVGARAAGGWLGDRVDPRRLVMAGLALLVIGLAALAEARGPLAIALYAATVGAGYGLNYLAATVLLLNYYGRARNLELFSTVCLISTLASVGPLMAGALKDGSGSFAPAFLIIAGVTAAVLLAVFLMRPPRTAAASFTAG